MKCLPVSILWLLFFQYCPFQAFTDILSHILHIIVTAIYNSFKYVRSHVIFIGCLYFQVIRSSLLFCCLSKVCGSIQNSAGWRVHTTLRRSSVPQKERKYSHHAGHSDQLSSPTVWLSTCTHVIGTSGTMKTFRDYALSWWFSEKSSCTPSSACP